MHGYLFVVEPDQNVFVGRVASLKKCRNEQDVELLLSRWQERVGERFVVLDSRLHHGWGPAMTTAASGKR